MKRLRESMNAVSLIATYAVPHSDRSWLGHRLRVDVTIALARQALRTGRPNDDSGLADLSCGDARIARALRCGRGRLALGDIAFGYEYQGPITETVERIPSVDVFVCTETIEHLDDPPAVLVKIRGKAKHLVLSTPLEAWDDPNPEHYWAWSREDVEGMLRGAGWEPVVFMLLDTRPIPEMYQYGIWVCS